MFRDESPDKLNYN